MDALLSWVIIQYIAEETNLPTGLISKEQKVTKATQL